MAARSTESYQAAMLEDASFILEIGPSHADAYLEIESGVMYLRAPGVDTRVPSELISRLREIFEAAERFGLSEDS